MTIFGGADNEMQIYATTAQTRKSAPAYVAICFGLVARWACPPNWLVLNVTPTVSRVVADRLDKPSHSGNREMEQ